MISHKELRVGNYIHDKDENLLVVTGIAPDSNYGGVIYYREVYGDDDEDNLYEIEENIFPIRITEEKLKDFGFFCSHQNKYCPSYRKDILEIARDINYRWFNEDYSRYGNTGVRYDYIHEIQNLYYITTKREL